MNFLYPGFLFAVLAVGIPILIHLFNFRKFKKVYFSNVQFLTEAREENASREKLKNLLILCSRILAIVFLVLAFARPYWSSGPDKGVPGLRNRLNIYIDNSYSMEAVNKEGTLLDEAKRKAMEVVKLYGVNDQFSLLTNEFDVKNQRYVDKEEFAGLLEEVKISPQNRTLQQVVNRLQYHTAGAAGGLSYLISDFQKSFVGKKPLEISADAQFSLLKLEANPLPNIAVDSAWFLSPAHLPGGTEQLVVRLHNYSEEDARGTSLKLRINQQQKALATVNIPAGRSVIDTLSFGGMAAGWQKGVLSIKDFPLTFDDVFNFSFEVRAQLKVLNIRGTGAGKYIASVFGADRYFSVDEMPEANIKYSSFSGYNLIVLDGLEEPSSGLSQQLKTYISSGGSVVVFPDLDGNMPAYSAFLKSLSLPAVEKLNDGQPLSSSMDLTHPLFKDVFEELPRNIDLPEVKRYFSYVHQNASRQQRVLSLPFNQAFFSAYRLGEGMVYLSASSLSPADNGLSTHPIFVPLMYKVAFAAVREQPLHYTSGRDNVLEYKKINLGKNQPLKLVSKDLDAIPELRQVPGKTLLYIADQVKTAGFYELKKADSLLAVMAFNDDRAESDMHYASEEQLKSAFGKNLSALLEGRAATKNVEMRNNPAELWKLCLILTAVFLAVEILLIRFFNHSKNRIST